VGCPPWPYLSTATPQNCVSSLISLLSVVGRDTPKDIPTLVVLVAAGLIGVGQSEGPEESRLSKLRPYE
jgi:hypothetical protein